MKVLVIVDMQNDFIDGSLGTKEAQAIVPKVVEKIKGFEGVAIITQDTHFDDYLETQEGKNLPVKHCVKGTDGWELNLDVLDAMVNKNGITIEKPTFGADILQDAYGVIEEEDGEIESVEFVGLCTDICVISNVLLTKAFMPEVPLIVDASCCAGVTPESHKNALEAMKMCQIKIINE